MFTKKEFIKKIKELPEVVPSKTGKALYNSFNLIGNTLYFKRVVPKTDWNLDILTLYKVYSTQTFINTSVVKSITKGRINSPSVAILMAIKCIDKFGHRIK